MVYFYANWGLPPYLSGVLAITEDSDFSFVFTLPVNQLCILDGKGVARRKSCLLRSDASCTVLPSQLAFS